jgi:polyprenyl-phospho-N-acetylgalactosaminyl synthase
VDTSTLDPKLLKERVCAVIPALNEENSIAKIVSSTSRFVDDVLVVDDRSEDGTAARAVRAGARVVTNNYAQGAHLAILCGIRSVDDDSSIVVTLDADGQHPPENIPRLLQPIRDGVADLVIGRRHRSQVSETPVRKIVKSLLHVNKELDVGSGFRGFRRNFLSQATPEDLGFCSCGSLVLFALEQSARITEVPFRYRPREFGRSRFARINKNALHERQTKFLLERYGRSGKIGSFKI